MGWGGGLCLDSLDTSNPWPYKYSSSSNYVQWHTTLILYQKAVCSTMKCIKWISHSQEMAIPSSTENKKVGKMLLYQWQNARKSTHLRQQLLWIYFRRPWTLVVWPFHPWARSARSISYFIPSSSSSSSSGWIYSFPKIRKNSELCHDDSFLQLVRPFENHLSHCRQSCRHAVDTVFDTESGLMMERWNVLLSMLFTIKNLRNFQFHKKSITTKDMSVLRWPCALNFFASY